MLEIWQMDHRYVLHQGGAHQLPFPFGFFPVFPVFVVVCIPTETSGLSVHAACCAAKAPTNSPPHNYDLAGPAAQFVYTRTDHRLPPFLLTRRWTGSPVPSRTAACARPWAGWAARPPQSTQRTLTARGRPVSERVHSMAQHACRVRVSLCVWWGAGHVPLPLLASVACSEW